MTIAIFLIIIGITLAITYWAARRTKTASEFYAAGRSLKSSENGLAITGDYLSAAAFLGFTGLVALYGMDGALYAVGALVAFLGVLLFVAEPLRNTGKYTMADVIAYRMQRRPARLAAVVGTIVVSLTYLIPQMAGGGVLIKLLLGIPYSVSVIVVGLAIILYVAFGGMLATSWVQIVKAILLMTVGIVFLIWIMALFRFNLLALFASAEGANAAGYLSPGNYLKNPLDQISVGMSFALGTAGLPHILMRFYTVPDAKTARGSVVWVVFLGGTFFLITTVTGFAATYLVGRESILAADPGGNLALPLLAQYLGGGADSVGGQAFLAVVSAVAFATILAVVAGLTLATSGAIAHDLYVNIIKRGHVEERTQVRVARLTTLVVGVLAIVLGLLAQGVNVAVLVILAFAVAASANFPIIVLSLYWRRFNTWGVIGGVTVGLISSVALALLGPTFLAEGAIFPLINPSIVSVPLGFAGAVLGTLLGGRDRAAEVRFDEVRFRAQTGEGAEA